MSVILIQAGGLDDLEEIFELLKGRFFNQSGADGTRELIGYRTCCVRDFFRHMHNGMKKAVDFTFGDKSVRSDLEELYPVKENYP